jgi:hypothetical protein
MKLNSEPLNPLLILQNWRDSHALIKSRLDGSGFSLELWVKVTEADAQLVILTALGGEADKLTFDPSRAEILYEEPPVRTNAESKVVCSLSVLLPDGFNLLLYERRTDEEGIP